MVAISGTYGTSYNCRGNTVDGSTVATYGEPDGSVLLNAGQIHVTFSTQNSNVGVDFWIFSPSQISGWTNAASCEDLASLPNIYYGHNWSTYDGLVSIPATGGYYFAFENYGSDAASVTITVTQVTASQGTNYVTQSTVFPTQQVISVPQQAGLGPLFYIGIVAIIAGIIVLVVSRATTSGAGATQQTIGRTEATEAPIQEEPVMKESFCTNCGAKLGANAKFCKECGSSVT
jgi:ribosomal protein L40E